MLLELHVRNLALIEKADIQLGGGLTILSGETGAGKSILIDSINIALGERTGRDIIRAGAEYAYVELLFAIDDKEKLKKIQDMDINVEEDGVLIVSRKITPTRSIMKVNDETVTQARLRSLTGILLDMHGQFEHQSLLYPSRHLAIIDKSGRDIIEQLKKDISILYKEYSGIEKDLSVNEDARLREREADILRYEIKEIEEAELKEGEEEELLNDFRRLKNASKISEALGQAQTGLETEDISHAVKYINEAAAYDENLADIKKQLSDIDGMINDALRSVSEYIDSMEYDEEKFTGIEARLDVIHRLQGKYGDDVASIVKQAEEKRERLEYLDNYDANRRKLTERKEKLEAELNKLCTELTKERKATAEILAGRIKEELRDLNFLGCEFEIRFEKLTHYTEGGDDSAEFVISTNPGNPMLPLKDVASGGELSRIMLALKTVLADTDEIETLIFDEIDAGISGKTAQKVAEKLRVIGRKHQVICITHLPQIAAMADNHYLISKSTDGQSTKTSIDKLEDEAIIRELARLMSGDEISESGLAAARDLKEKAKAGLQK